MALTILSDFLAPPAVGATATYAVDTTTRIRLPGQVLDQATTTILHVTVLETGAMGQQLAVLTQELRTPASSSPFAELLLDIARANSPLHVATDLTGQLTRITNKTELTAQWQELLPWLLRKYQQTPGAAELLTQVGDQYSSANDRLEQAIANKGAYGVLLPGCYGLCPTRQQTRTDAKTLHQFFSGGNLPLLVDWQSAPTDTFDQSAKLTGTGRLDVARFDHSAFQQHVANMMGPVARPPGLQVAWQEHYTVSRTGQGLLAGEQTLRVGIAGVYEQQTRHELRQTAFTESAFPTF